MRETEGWVGDVGVYCLRRLHLSGYFQRKAIEGYLSVSEESTLFPGTEGKNMKMKDFNQDIPWESVNRGEERLSDVYRPLQCAL